ncbi:hypothetical protein F5X68DRAFT_245792 [Plectosphaerella plurivora]|uniref:Uncharacterized protein n=1 Tax=Plectosphaerella plurivora TaxID=936078 RepID=A0A9P9A7X5_9PEZI|nr:hypothetical protein F5X68DRAFT_245792 [Plectosphaerella plurivora]
MPDAAIEATTRLDSAFPNHPHFPEKLSLNKAFSNAITASGRTTWTTSPLGAECCEFPAFQEEMVTEVAWDRPTEVVLTDDPLLDDRCRSLFADGDEHHIPILFLTWAYVLSARWAELMPGALGPTYDKSNAAPFLGDIDDRPSLGQTEASVVDIGDGNGWEASILNDKGKILYSPWSTTIVLATTSLQNEAALVSALLIPLAKFDGRRINLSLPRSQTDQILLLPPWGEKTQQLDRLLTFGSNPGGIKALLGSIFFEPGIDCNTCGPWLQGSFAFIDSDEANPGPDFLWIDARAGWADECCVLFLAHGPSHTTAPLFPFPPFGHTAKEDADLEAHRLGYSGFEWDCEDGRRVVQAGSDKALIRFKICPDPAEQEVGRNIEVDYSRLDEEEDDNDEEDETSEMVTRNIFEWLRGDAGFPVAERAIRQHPWIDNLESYDEEENVQGVDVRSVPGDNPLRGWMLGVATARCNSL